MFKDLVPDWGQNKRLTHFVAPNDNKKKEYPLPCTIDFIPKTIQKNCDVADKKVSWVCWRDFNFLLSPIKPVLVLKRVVTRPHKSYISSAQRSARDFMHKSLSQLADPPQTWICFVSSTHSTSLSPLACVWRRKGATHPSLCHAADSSRLHVRSGDAAALHGPSCRHLVRAAVRPDSGGLWPLFHLPVGQEQRSPHQPVPAASGLRLPERSRGTAWGTRTSSTSVCKQKLTVTVTVSHWKQWFYQYCFTRWCQVCSGSYFTHWNE